MTGTAAVAGPGRGRRLAYAVIAVLALLVVGQRSLLVESLGALRLLRWEVPLLADYPSRAAASTHRSLLRVGGGRISQHVALQVAYPANAVSATLPVAGAQLGAAFTLRRLRRAGASPATTAWTSAPTPTTRPLVVPIATASMASRAAYELVAANPETSPFQLPRWTDRGRCPSSTGSRSLGPPT